jgi:hypothetical protein
MKIKIFIKDIFNKTNFMGSENFFGQMVIIIVDNIVKDCVKDQVS